MFGLREREIVYIPFEATKFGTHRLSIFLPKFINVLVRNSFRLNFIDFKQHLKENMFILLNNFMKDAYLMDYMDNI